MKREDFIKNIIRYILFGMLAFIVVFVGNKAVASSDCTSCPGKGMCSGEIDCSKFLKK